MVVIPEDEYNAANGSPLIRSEEIMHYGTPRHSGRYPWGSGGDENSSQRNKTLLDMDNDLRKKGLSETERATGLGLTTKELRSLRTIVRNEQKQDQIHIAQQLKDKGMSNGAIAKRMREGGYDVKGESQVRALLQPSLERKTAVLDNVTNTLRDAVDKKGYLDVGAGVEFQLNTTTTKVSSALQRLKDEGYEVHPIQVEQLGTGKQTNMKVLVPAGTTRTDVLRNRDKIQQLDEYSDDGGLTSLGIAYPKSISSKRVGIRYDEDGGSAADGVIYVRPGVKDVSLGKSRYAQVRVMVDGTHYLKGMAVEKDDLPDGVDLLFNTNKKNSGNKLDALKELKRNKDGTIDKDNPFGATISRQIGDRTPDGKIINLTSAMNIVNSEADWDKWSRSLSSQVLSKQRPALAKEQLDLAYQNKKSELEGILDLNNPSVKRKLLEAYSDGADASAVHLKAAALPRQKTHVILPVSEMKEGEVYAPNFNNGERVALIRFPHGGTFEIPELTVNNKNAAAKKLLGDSKAAIGMHPRVAERLSGADFDGDTVLVIPNNQGKIRSTSPLEGLKNFDPKSSYAPYDGMRTIDGGTYNAKTKKVDYGGRSPMLSNKGTEMGKVSNLITDMTIQDANTEELARAVRHSMVVIDAEKHSLDYRRSESDNGIAALKKEYQRNNANNGAATLISRASSRLDVLDRRDRSPGKGGPIDPATGKKVYENTNKSRTYVDDKGAQHVVPKMLRSTKLAETDNAHTLSSGTVIEKVYADHSNKLKALANQARKATLSIRSNPYSPSAKKTFASDVESLNSKLNLALRNAPLERQAQVFANATVRLKIQDNPDLKAPDNRAELRRMKSQALTGARLRTGAEKKKFDISESEWLAIQAGAISAHKLDQILTYADLKQVKELATPKKLPKLTPAKASRAKSMHASGYTWAEIASALGVSASTVQRELADTEGD